MSSFIQYPSSFHWPSTVSLLFNLPSVFLIISSSSSLSLNRLNLDSDIFSFMGFTVRIPRIKVPKINFLSYDLILYPIFLPLVRSNTCHGSSQYLHFVYVDSQLCPLVGSLYSIK